MKPSQWQNNIAHHSGNGLSKRTPGRTTGCDCIHQGKEGAAGSRSVSNSYNVGAKSDIHKKPGFEIKDVNKLVPNGATPERGQERGHTQILHPTELTTMASTVRQSTERHQARQDGAKPEIKNKPASNSIPTEVGVA